MSNTTNMIVISGSAQHGKDTTAQLLCDSLKREGYKVLVTHYADLLKYICKEYFGWNGEKDTEGRTLLQYVGTNIVRNKMPDFWAEFVTNIVLLFGYKWDFVIVADCRFPNEVDIPKQSGIPVYHLHVIRSGFDNGLNEEQKSHASEVAMDDVVPDRILINDGGLSDLELKVNALTEEYLYGLL